MKKKVFLTFGAMALTTCLIPSVVNAATSFDGMKDGNTITLTEDVTLSDKFVVNEGETLTIDLNGYTLTGPNNNYAIDNSGTLKIIDNGQAKGKISCTDDSSSCIRNLGNLNIEGVTAEGPFVVVKNDVEGDMYGDLNILNSTLTSSYTKSNTGTIMNWGKAEVTNSKVNASASGIAIYATSGAKPGKNSEITLNNNILDGKYSIYEKRYAATDKNGQNVKGENAVNPKTSDMIITVVLIAIIALAGMAIAVIKLRKKNA